MSRLAALALCALLTAAGNARAQDQPLRDPMQPFSRAAGAVLGAPAPGPRFQLTAVLISAQRRVAIVNGKSYQLGEHVDGAEITRIEAQTVHLRQAGENLVIHLGRPGQRRAPATQGDSVP